MITELIICTKDRPDEVSRCLKSVITQSEAPVRVIIVDSSRNESTRRVSEDAKSDMTTEVVYLSCEPGLTHQRNVGLNNLLESTDIVHFVDDDTVLEPDYVAAMNEEFLMWPNAVGGTGFITNLPNHKLRFWRRLALSDGPDGAVLKSGINLLNFGGKCGREVAWLSGCSMSYRVRMLKGLRFDERRTGNGLGEDVDFSLRASARGDLFWTPQARLAHIQSPINREAAFRVARRNVHHRWLLAEDGVDPVRKWAIVYSVLASAVAGTILAVLTASRYRLRMELASLLGLGDVLTRRARY